MVTGRSARRLHGPERADRNLWVDVALEISEWKRRGRDPGKASGPGRQFELATVFFRRPLCFVPGTGGAERCIGVGGAGEWRRKAISGREAAVGTSQNYLSSVVAGRALARLQLYGH